MPADFITAIATKLATDLIKSGASRLKSVFSDAQQQAFRRAYERAFTEMLKQAATGLSTDDQSHVDDIWRSFVGNPDVAYQLLDMALDERPLALDDPRVRFELLDFDPSTFQVDFESAMSFFVRGLHEGLQEEAIKPGSPLYNQVSLTKLNTLLRLHEETHKILSPIFTPLQIYEACNKITALVAERLFKNQTVTQRQAVKAKLEDFLTSSQRYAVVLGPSGVGKSMTMADQATCSLKTGWAALLMEGGTFTLNYLAEVIIQDGLSQDYSPGWRQVVVSPWRGELPPHIHGFVILIDAIDEADPSVISHELLRLDNAVSSLPLDRFKVIASCRDLAWAGITKGHRFPFWVEGERSTQPKARSVRVIEVTDFEPEELNNALQRIGATELVTVRRPGEPSDPHIETVRDLIKHPAAFGLYAELHASGDISSIQNLTWSNLVERHLEEALRKVEAKCRVSSDTLHDNLITLANLMRKHKSRDLYLSRDLIKGELLELKMHSNDSTQSGFAALKEEGILAQRRASGAKQLIGFRIPDVGKYLLSFVLEREADLPIEDDHKFAKELVYEAHDYLPLLDAILAWTDRLADEPRNTILLNLLDVLVDEHLFIIDVVFGLMRPKVLDSLFELARTKERHYFYAFHRKAVHAVRHSPESLQIIRNHLRDSNPGIQEIAVELAGVHRDLDSIPELINLLQAEEEDVCRKAYFALGRIGKAAVPHLLTIIGDISQSTERREHCIRALRSIGFRNDEVSAVLESCLNEGLAGSLTLLRESIKTIDRLRDVRLSSYAKEALLSEDAWIVDAAAKVLAESDDPDVGPRLREAVDVLRQTSDEKTFGPYWALLRLLKAIIKIEGSKSTPFVLQTIVEILRGDGPISQMEAIFLADDLDLPAAHGILLEDLVNRLRKTPPDPQVWQSVIRLGATWRPEHLQALDEANNRLADQGIDVVEQIINAIIQGNQAEGNHPLRDPNAQGAALLTAAKCRASSFVIEASRLLKDAPEFIDMDICEFFWVLQDPQAEGALLVMLEQPAREKRLPWYEKNRVIRALGTCCTERGKKKVLDFLRTISEAELNLSEEGIYPLVRRGVVSSDELSEIVLDSNASIAGRTSCLVALGIADAPGHKEVFQRIILQEKDQTLKGYAARMLAFAEDLTVSLELQQLLSTDQSFVAEQAACSLARLNANEAVPLIEQSFGRFADTNHASGFIEALAHFRQPSSLQVIIDGMEKLRFASSRHDAIEALGAFLPDDRAKQIILERLETWMGEHYDRGEQYPAIKALIRHDPNFLLDRAIKLYDEGHLDKSARQGLAYWIPYLAQHQDEVESIKLIELLKRLAQDLYLPVREVTYQSLGVIDPELCSKLYAGLYSITDRSGWAQSCAVHCLGFWDNDENEIRAARYAEDRLIRRAADAALEMYRKRQALKECVVQYKSADRLIRLGAYLSIKEQATEDIIMILNKTTKEGEIPHVFLRQLSSSINERAKNETKKQWDEEKKFLNSTGLASFSLP
jgi:HEAT repeat protein